MFYNMDMSFKDKTKKIVSEQSFFKLEKYVELIEEKNKVMNLTGFSDDRLWEEGIYESIFLLINSFGKVSNKKILDIGAGAGFPSVPYLIAFPQNELTIYEPIKKRTLFLEEVKKTLSLNIDIKNIRAEESKDLEKFDLITARAVAPFKILAEISHRPAKIGAIFAFLKGPRAKEEIQDASKICRELSIKPTVLNLVMDTRDNYVITYTKDCITPLEFPREWKIIKSS